MKDWDSKRWLQRLLAERRHEQPTTGDLINEVASPGDGGGKTSEFIKDNPVLARAVRAGLAELDRQAGRVGGHLVIALDRPELRAAAAGEVADLPGPDRRVVLADRPGVCRLTLFQRRGQFWVGLFCHDPLAEARLNVAVDGGGAVSPAKRPRPGVILVAIGAPHQLPNATVDMVAQVGDLRLDQGLTFYARRGGR